MRFRRLLVPMVPLLAIGLSAVAAAPATASPSDVGNVIQLGDGSLLPVYPVTGSATTDAVGFQLSAGVLSAIEDDGTTRWTANTTGHNMFGGFDYDGNGWPDVAVVISAGTGGTCGNDQVTTTTIYIFSGSDGTLSTPLSPMQDKCWSFPGTTPYVTHQWTNLGLLWGDETSQLLANPYYATTSWYLGYNGSSFTTDGALYFPSTSSYDAAYTADQPNAYGTGTSYVANSHIANGLLTNVGGQNRAVFWTSSRVVQYAIGALSSGQLLYDKPYLTAGRTDIAGRNYGLTAVDPGAANKIALLAGAGNYTLFQDLRDSAMTHDPWGGIERHVSVYDASTNAVDDRFYSYAHDNNDGDKYQGRVSFPANPWVRRSGPSRLAYNVYDGGHWWLHVSAPGSTTDLYALKDAFLWDIADVDADGVDDWLISPTRYPSEPDVPGYYFPHFETSVQHWDESTLTLTAIRTYSDAVPYLQKMFTAANTSSSEGYLSPANVLVQSGQRKIALLDSSRSVVLRTP